MSPANPRKSRRSHVAPQAPLISLDTPGRLRLSNVMAVSGLSASTIYKRISEGAFPPARKDGRTSYWITYEVRDALDLPSEPSAAEQRVQPAGASVMERRAA